ncbi:Zinc finger RING-CH-type domain containing protein [Klebsormidium nitens]|uniref:Zinc finger RING-CH-type domain containing protein n=1 Tax=Klebsormidium nitens TaxID=105231 RepID=A0A1Y1HSH4_KLENI|nr:Zinc finger RING-CH-type domain containing protein [Klebsormidium nitens]|eukprot:GAQ79941.1 Zinc finger RING-CH-type domain containing protein [Klebsormidium nitens]
MTSNEDGAADALLGEPSSEHGAPAVAISKPDMELKQQAGGQDNVIQVEGPDESLSEGLADKEVTTEEGLDGEKGPLLAESRSMEAGRGKVGESELIECRICQEEDELANLDTPCACTGSVKYAHPKCVQRWSNEKGDAVCEICHQPYKGYTAVPRPPPQVSVALPLEFADDWALAGQRLSDPRLLHQYTLDVDYNEYEGHASTTAWCRSAALIFMALLLLRHALGMIAAGADDDDETPAIFTVFLLKAIGFILPCYIMARAISVAQQRRQQQDAMAYFVQQGHVRGVPIVVAPRRLPEGVV